MKRNNRTRLAALLLVFMTITACGKELEHIEPLPIESIPQSEESIEVETSTISTEPAYTSYLTGLPVTEELQNKRPIAVMLNNIEAGCPQYGIAKASVIYEAPVESRITRLMGIFEDWEGIEKIGYVRSSRDYFTLKQYFPGSQKSADYPLPIFKAFYLAQPKGLCGNYRSFPAKCF